MATASIWTPSVGSFYSTQDGPYHDSQYTRSAANTAESSLPETSFTEVFKQMGELWEAYMSNNVRSPRFGISCLCLSVKLIMRPLPDAVNFPQRYARI